MYGTAGRKKMAKKNSLTRRLDVCESLCRPFIMLQSQIEQLKAELEGRKKIEKAKWILIKSKGIDEDEAHILLINHSRANRKKLIDVAETIIIGERVLAQGKMHLKH